MKTKLNVEKGFYCTVEMRAQEPKRQGCGWFIKVCGEEDEYDNDVGNNFLP